VGGTVVNNHRDDSGAAAVGLGLAVLALIVMLVV
jgi:hypothetical protein